MSFKFVPIAVLAMLAACTPAADTPAPVFTGPIVGVLEERPGATTEEAARFVVRAAFHKDGDSWRAFDVACADENCLTAATSRVPQETSWTISLDGQPQGEVTTRTPQAWTFYADVGRQEFAQGADPAPQVGERSGEWGNDGAVHRPLVATSPAAFADPQAWTETAATPALQQTLRQAFRAQFASVTNCPNETSAPAPQTYADSDIAIAQTHAASDGWSIATLTLGDYGCDGPVEGAFAPQTFAVSPTGEARLLGEGLRLVDAGDFDGNGQSELIFAIQRYNQGGYELYADGFAQNATLEFSYH